MALAIQVMVADAFGRVLDEVQPELGAISWLLNGVGGVTLRMETRNAKWREDYFRFGGMVLLELNNGLPPWAGVAVRRGWPVVGLAEVEYLSAEAILYGRYSGRNQVFEGVPAGGIAAGLLAFTNARRETGIEAGAFWLNSTGLTRTYHLTQIYQALEDLRADTRGDWGVLARGTVSTRGQKRVNLRLCFWERRGVDRPDVALVEGGNMSVVNYTEQTSGGAGLVNDWQVAGGGNSWGEDGVSGERLVGTGRDTDSVAAYNLREGAEVLNEVADQPTLNARAAARLAGSLSPFRAMTVLTTNKAPGLFGAYDVGDRVAVLAHSVGFEGVDELARVTGREFDPVSQVCKLSLELEA